MYLKIKKKKNEGQCEATKLAQTSFSKFYRCQRTKEMSIKVAVLGAWGDGKSAVTLRYLRDFFITDWDPTLEGMHH